MSKRKDYISWEQFFMNTARNAAKRSKDPVTQVGVCVVIDNKILGVGYNGLPRGCSDDEFPWTSPEKYLYVCHAEANALMNVNNFNLLKGSTIYTTLFPCNECAKLIIQLGIKNVIFLKDRNGKAYEASKKMLDTVKIEYSLYRN